MKRKKNVLFVGSFIEKSKTGGVGGQMYACTSLINSDLSNKFNWIKIDSTAESNLHISIIQRSVNASIRILKLIFYLLFRKIDSVLIFSSNGFSFIEKGLMGIIASYFSNKKVIFAPRSGRLLDELKGKRLRFAQILFKRSDHIICQGDSWKDYFNNNVLVDNGFKYVVVKNWLNTELYHKSDRNKEEINLLFLAWIEKDKGIFDLIQALNNVVNSGIKNFRLNIAGKGKDEIEAKNIVNKLGLDNYIKFCGWVLGKDKIELLSNSDIFILPSYFEGSPNALLEAMASGNACIASNVGAIPDIIESGENGIISMKSDIFELSKNISFLINSKENRTQLSINALSYIRKDHDIKVAVKQFESILN